MNKPLILVVEDDSAVRNLIVTTLETQDYKYHTASKGSEAILEAVSQKPDVVLLDLGLPDMDGIDIIKKIRSWSNMPIIVISARSEDRDKIDALDAGADDYLTKPFSSTELLARIRVALRHMYKQGGGKTQTLFQVGELQLDAEKRRVFLRGEEIHVTPMEYSLLTLLFKNQGKVLTTAVIIREIWGPGYGNDTQALRALMAGLRRKLEKNPAKPRYILTEIGVGYRLTDE